MARYPIALQSRLSAWIPAYPRRPAHSPKISRYLQVLVRESGLIGGMSAKLGQECKKLFCQSVYSNLFSHKFLEVFHKLNHSLFSFDNQKYGIVSSHRSHYVRVSQGVY